MADESKGHKADGPSCPMLSRIYSSAGCTIFYRYVVHSVNLKEYKYGQTPARLYEALPNKHVCGGNIISFGILEWVVEITHSHGGDQSPCRMTTITSHKMSLHFVGPGDMMNGWVDFKPGYIVSDILWQSCHVAGYHEKMGRFLCCFINSELYKSKEFTSNDKHPCSFSLWFKVHETKKLGWYAHLLTWAPIFSTHSLDCTSTDCGHLMHIHHHRSSWCSTSSFRLPSLCGPLTQPRGLKVEEWACRDGQSSLHALAVVVL